MAMFTTLHADLDFTAYQNTTTSEPLQTILTELQTIGALNTFKIDMQLHVTQSNFNKVEQKVEELYAAGLFEKTTYSELKEQISFFVRYYMNLDPN